MFLSLSFFNFITSFGLFAKQGVFSFLSFILCRLLNLRSLLSDHLIFFCLFFNSIFWIRPSLVSSGHFFFFAFPLVLLFFCFSSG